MLSWLTCCSHRVGGRADRQLLVHPEHFVVVCLVVVRFPQHAITCGRPPLKIQIIVLRRPHEPLRSRQTGVTLRISVASWWQSPHFPCNTFPSMQHNFPTRGPVDVIAYRACAGTQQAHC